MTFIRKTAAKPALKNLPELGPPQPLKDHEKTKFTEERIAYALKQAESGTLILDLCRRLGVSEQTFYR